MDENATNVNVTTQPCGNNQRQCVHTTDSQHQCDHNQRQRDKQPTTSINVTKQQTAIASVKVTKQPDNLTSQLRYQFSTCIRFCTCITVEYCLFMSRSTNSHANNGRTCDCITCCKLVSCCLSPVYCCCATVCDECKTCYEKMSDNFWGNVRIICCFPCCCLKILCTGFPEDAYEKWERERFGDLSRN